VLAAKSNARNAVARPEDKAITQAEAASVFARFFKPDDHILIAVSGGPDSMALLALLSECRQAKLHAVTVDHGLRAQSLDEAKAVAAFCKHVGIPHSILTWDGRKPASGLQQAARTARYALLCDFARAHGLSCLVTAHHADDQAETILMRLTSGSGLAGLAGMREERMRFEMLNSKGEAIRHVRPLLAFSKASLVMSCKARGIDYVEDQSNDDPKFERVRMRRIMDQLAADGLSRERLLRLAERASLADEALEFATENVLANITIAYNGQSLRFDWSSLAAEPKAVRQRVIPKLLEQLSSATFVEKLDRLEALVDEIDAAFMAQKALRRSIGHWIVSLVPSGMITISAAPARQRGTKAKI
jgi:tRNA(Ile)-lysidine synthase